MRHFIWIVLSLMILLACKSEKSVVKVEPIYNQLSCDADKSRFRDSMQNLGPRRAIFALGDCISKLNDAEALALKKEAEVKAFVSEVQDESTPVGIRLSIFGDFKKIYPEESASYLGIENRLSKDNAIKNRNLQKSTAPTEADVAANEQIRLAKAKKSGVYIGMTRKEVVESREHLQNLPTGTRSAVLNP